MNELFGKKIESVLINDKQDLLVFTLNGGGEIAYVTDADCCSETWFSDITGVTALLGAEVTEVNTVDLSTYNVDDGRGRQEHDQVYGYKITTNKGYCDIVFRNSSNGYYGGSIELANTFEEELSELTKIVDDWRA